MKHGRLGNSPCPSRASPKHFPSSIYSPRRQTISEAVVRELGLRGGQRAFAVGLPNAGAPGNGLRQPCSGCHRQHGHPWVSMHEDYVKVFIQNELGYFPLFLKLLS